jgi:hypothetical protein
LHADRNVISKNGANNLWLNFIRKWNCSIYQVIKLTRIVFISKQNKKRTGSFFGNSGSK